MDSLQSKKDEGWIYLSKILKKNKHEALTIAESMKPHKCSDCYCYSFSPWFSLEDISTSFSTDVSRHQAGWLNLHHVLVSDTLGTIQFLNQEILKELLTSHKVGSYAEIGMPFNGINLLEFSRGKSLFQKIRSFANAAMVKIDSRSSFSVQFYDCLSNIFIIISCAILTLEGFIRSTLRNRGFKRNEEINISSAKKYYLPHPTSYGWGTSDQAFGVSSTKLGAKLFDLKILPLNDAVKNSKQLDLVGIFNFIDHFTDPLEVIEMAMAISNLIVISVHPASFAGKQHRFAIDKNFVSFLQRRYSSWDISLMDMSHLGMSAIDTYNVFVLEKK